MRTNSASAGSRSCKSPAHSDVLPVELCLLEAGRRRDKALGAGMPYMVTGDEGHVVLAGRIAVGADASCRLDLSDKLAEGRYTLSTQLIVNGNAMNAEITRFPFEVLSRP
jgi:hypothetical protein